MLTVVDILPLGDGLRATVFFFGYNLISWSSKRLGVIFYSCAEAEYKGVANVITRTCWICNLQRELHYPPNKAIIFYYDNISIIYIILEYQHTKHIEIDIHFICDKVATGIIRVLHVPSSS